MTDCSSAGSQPFHKRTSRHERVGRLLVRGRVCVYVCLWLGCRRCSVWLAWPVVSFRHNHCLGTLPQSPSPAPKTTNERTFRYTLDGPLNNHCVCFVLFCFLEPGLCSFVCVCVCVPALFRVCGKCRLRRHCDCGCQQCANTNLTNAQPLWAASLGTPRT
mgnify:CR=1 FL=1